MPRLRDDLRTIAWWITVGFVVGACVGAVVGGVGGRLVMLVLRLASDDAIGVVSDDGFTIGEFSVSDTSQLVAATAAAGAINGTLYVAARPFVPDRVRIPLWTLVGAAVVGAGVVHTDGVDFLVLEPLWFAVGAFVALPGLAAFLVAWFVERAARREPWRLAPWHAVLALPALPALLVAPLALVVGAVALAAGRVWALRRLPRAAYARAAAVVVLLALIVAGSVDLWRDATEIL